MATIASRRQETLTLIHYDYAIVQTWGLHPNMIPL